VQQVPASQLRAVAPVKGADLDAVVKDAQNLMNELNRAPPLSSKEEAAAAAAANAMYRSGSAQGNKGAFDAAVDMLTAGDHGEADTPTGGTGTPGRRGGSRSHRRGLHSSSSTRNHRQTATPRTSSKLRARGQARGGFDGAPLPPSILEQPIQDAAHDAYYGGAADEEVQVSTPNRSKRGKRGDLGPRSLSRQSKRSVQSGRARGPTSLQSGHHTPNASPRSVRSAHNAVSPSRSQAYARARLEREQSFPVAAAPGL
jgi:hypothetical protein